MAYRGYYVTIKRADEVKADQIILEHWDNGDIDTVRREYGFGVDCTPTVTYWISPYIYEDFETIKREFIQSGITLL